MRDGRAGTSGRTATNTFRYRLTVEVASGTKVSTASGVIQVKMKIGGIVFSNVATPEVTGDAVVVDVPDHAPIFVLRTIEGTTRVSPV